MNAIKRAMKTFEQIKWNEEIEDPLKLTAMSTLREALSNERYDQMKEIIEVAREFGVKDWEIERSLRSHILDLNRAVL